MKTKLFSIVCISLLFLTACNFVGEESKEEEEPAVITKQINAVDTVKEKNVEVKDSHPEVHEITELKAPSTLEKDSLYKLLISREQSYREQIEALKQEVKAAKNSTSIKLQKSTYVPIRSKQVEDYLDGIYLAELRALKARGRDESTLHESFKKFFTLEYCDDRVLKFLDDFARATNENVAARMRLNYTRVEDPHATTREIIRYK